MGQANSRWQGFLELLKCLRVNALGRIPIELRSTESVELDGQRGGASFALRIISRRSFAMLRALHFKAYKPDSHKQVHGDLRDERLLSQSRSTYTSGSGLQRMVRPTSGIARPRVARFSRPRPISCCLFPSVQWSYRAHA